MPRIAMMGDGTGADCLHDGALSLEETVPNVTAGGKPVSVYFGETSLEHTCNGVHNSSKLCYPFDGSPNISVNNFPVHMENLPRFCGHFTVTSEANINVNVFCND
jgi:hypothetical protein